MDARPALRRVGVTLGYGLLGSGVAAAAALGVLYVTQPLQRVVYHAVYLRVGPSDATQTAILTHFLLAAVAALALALVAGDALATRFDNRVAVGRCVAGLGAVLVAFLGLALAGLAALPVALLVLAVAAVAVPLALRFRYGVSSGSVPAFAGGVPVVVLLLLLAGFGLGWGWGYVVTAQEVPASAVGGDPASFADVPRVARDLFVEGDCGTQDGRRTCRLELRGYEHELRAVRFLARHGVRCPYRGGTGAGDAASFVAVYEGTYYRVSCVPHGD